MRVQNFPKKLTFDTCVCASAGKEFQFFGKLCMRTKLMIPRREVDSKNFFPLYNVSNVPKWSGAF